MLRSLLVGFALAGSAAAQTGEIVLTECSEFPAVDVRAVRYHSNGPSMYGVWYYDFVYRKVRTVLLNAQCEQPVTRTRFETERFSLNEQFGTREHVAADARAWLAQRVIERCE